MKKRTLLFIFALLSAMTASAQTLIDGIYYNLDASTNTATVTSGSSKYTGSVTIPETITNNGVTYSVTSIGWKAFFDCSGLTSVTIPNSVTSIGNFAFAYCSGLISVTIPNSVTSIGSWTFSSCSGLTSVIIPNSVTSIGLGAFSYCSGLTSIVVESGNTKYDSRNNCNAIIETAYNILLAGCKNTVIPNSVTSIGNSAFRGCSGLTSVIIPNSVTSIGESAFFDCSGLTSVTIPNGVTSIGNNAFQSCYVERDSFINNSSLDAEANNYWGLSFVDSREDGFIVANGVLVKYTGAENSITIPNSVTSIGREAFYCCSSLTSVTIPSSVTSVGNAAFMNCSGLTSVTIPSGVTSIGDSFFYNCSSLTSVTCEATSVPSTGYGVFYNVPQSSATLYVPASALDAYKTASQWSAFGTIAAIPDGGIRGDVNGDGEIGMPDVMFVVNYILGNPADTFNADAADANLDGEIGMPDVMFIVNYILNGKFPDE